MLLLIPVLLLLLAPIGLFAVRSVRNGYAYQWLIAVSSLVGVLAYLIFLRGRMPIEALVTTWQPVALFPVTPSLLLDSVAWPYAISVVSIAIAVLLTGVSRLTVGVWQPWAGTLALGAVALLSVMAGGPLMLLLTWAALDMVDVLIVLIQVGKSTIREQAVVALAARISGMGFLTWAMLLAKSDEVVLRFQSIPENISLYLLLAAGLRLGVIPLQSPLLAQLRVRRGLGTSLRLFPAASSLVLLGRVSSVGVPQEMMIFLLVFTAIASLYSALSWMLAQDVLQARPFWILGMAAFTVAAAIKGDFKASLAWGLALLLSGSFIFLLYPNHKRLLPLGFLGMVSISALPFSLTWAGLGMYSMPLSGTLGAINWLVNILLFLSHTCILLGFIKYALRLPVEKPDLEQWMWLVYPTGLVVLIIFSLSLGWGLLPEMDSIPVVNWVAGLFTLAAAVGVWWWGRRKAELPPAQSSFRRGSDWSTTLWAYLLSMKWLYRVAWLFYKGIGRVLEGFTRVLEGDGGLLWAFVLLGLLWSLFLG